jgi:hypothetical protein
VDSQRFARLSVRFERGADSSSVDPAGNQVEHAGQSQVNVIRSSNSGLHDIAVDGGGEGEGFPVFPLTPQFQLTRHAEIGLAERTAFQVQCQAMLGESRAALDP